MAIEFATTRWSVVLAARELGPDSRQALEWLCQTYWHAVYAFVRRRGHAPEQALELTQEFFVQRLERCDVGSADPERGRFRSWLLGTLGHFLSNARDYLHAQKRDPRKLLWIDATSAEERYRIEPRDQADPEQLYDRAWARTLLRRCLERLEAECLAKDKGWLFSTVKGSIYGEPDGAWYAKTAAELGMEPSHLRVTIHRLRRRWSDLVQEEIADLVEKPDDVLAEITALRQAFQRTNRDGNG